jgi:dihydrofolate reductase
MSPRVILYMAITANGYIARENGDAPWSEAVWDNFYRGIREKGNIIVGRRTYALMKDAGEFEKCGNPFVTVVTRTKKSEDRDDVNVSFVSSPREAIEVLRRRGFREIVVGGGGTLNAGFLKEGLIDEMILDAEPFIFGKGIKLFKEVDAEVKLELIEVGTLSANTVRLRYKIVKLS